MGGYGREGGLGPVISRDRSRSDDGIDGPGAAGSAVCCATGHAERSCTDGGCLLVLVAFMAGMGLIYSNARSEGNLDKLTHGFDWKGDICGVSEGVQDRPFLFWCVPGGVEGQGENDFRFLDGICVKQCPGASDTQSWCPEHPRSFEHRHRLANGTREVVIGMVRNLTLRQDYDTVEALGYCFPRKNLALLHRILSGTHVSTFTKQLYLAGHGAVESWRFLVSVACACVGIGYIFLLVLWYCFDKLVYALVAMAHALLLLATGLLVNAGFHAEQNWFTNYFEEDTAGLLAWTCAGVAFAVWALYALLCCYSKDAVQVTIGSVKATCEVVAQLPTMLLQPLANSAIVISSMLVLLYGFAWVLSTGKVVTEEAPMEQGGVEIAGLHRSLELTPMQWGCIAYWAFGTVWIFELVNALGQFAISHAVVINACFDTEEWFPMLHGYTVGLFYHLGTLAYGGFVIGCLKILAALLSFLVRQSHDEHGMQSAVAKVLCCCCMSCFACVEQLLTMVNDLVYTDVALQGSSYADAAANVVRIASSNPVTYVAIKGSATAVRVLGVTVIGGAGTFLSYRALSSTHFHRQLDLVFADASSMLVTSNIIGTTVAAGFVCFYIAMAFMMVFYQTTYTLMYCMLLYPDAEGEEVDRSFIQQREMRAHLMGPPKP